MASAFIAVLEIFLPLFPLEEENYKRRGKFGQFVKKGGNSADFDYKGRCHYTSLWTGQKGLQMALQSRFCTDCPCHSPPFYCMMKMCIRDSYYNDLELLRAAHFSATLADAPQDIKVHADMVCASCLEGGVAEFLGYLRKIAAACRPAFSQMPSPRQTGVCSWARLGPEYGENSPQ